jgi:hypothetical protein
MGRHRRERLHRVAAALGLVGRLKQGDVAGVRLGVRERLVGPALRDPVVAPGPLGTTLA